MKLTYLPISFHIKFTAPTLVDVNPLFILRSMLGKNLRSMCCISKQSTCPSCMYNKTCAYAYIFETILMQENNVLPGTNRASHPFSFSKKEQQKENPLTEFNFTITLFGKAIEYLPYVYAAFVRSGKDGIFKNRTSFEITNVVANGKNIFIDENHIDTNIEPLEWNFNFDSESTKNKNYEVLVDLQSPLRFKFNGKYGIDFSAQEFMKCLYRRAKTLCILYGKFESNFENYKSSDTIEITEKNLRWIDYNHYSARQKDSFSLGGAKGSFKLVGQFTDFELALFELNKIANAGKNTNFGLGQIDFWIREER